MLEGVWQVWPLSFVEWGCQWKLQCQLHFDLTVQWLLSSMLETPGFSRDTKMC
jgi:hypothetical protein